MTSAGFLTSVTVLVSSIHSCIYLDLCIFIPGFLSLYRFRILINTIINPITTAVDPMPAPMSIVAELWSSSDPTVKREVHHEI